MRKKQPELNFDECHKRCIAIWAFMNSGKDYKYKQEAKWDQERYNRQLAELEHQGWFVMPDGSKSSEEANLLWLQAYNYREEQRELKNLLHNRGGRKKRQKLA